MSKADLKANGIYNKYYSEFLKLDSGERKEYAIKCSLIDIKNTLDLLSSLRATKQILKQYRLYTEVKLKIEAIK